MVLMSHTVVGVAAASLFPASPVFAFSVAVASHFALDVIPHWNYVPPIFIESSDSKKKKWLKTFSYTGLDLLIGVLLAILFFSKMPQLYPLSFALAVIGAVLPDALFPIGFYKPIKPLVYLNKLHEKHHIHITDFAFGAIIQLLLIAFVIFLAKLFSGL